MCIVGWTLISQRQSSAMSALKEVIELSKIEIYYTFKIAYGHMQEIPMTSNLFMMLVLTEQGLMNNVLQTGFGSFGSKPLHVARTQKKPVPNFNRRRFGMGWYHYDQSFTPARQPMYASYPLSSPTSPPTTNYSPHSSSAHSYPTGMPGWPHAGRPHPVCYSYSDFFAML